MGYNEEMQASEKKGSRTVGYNKDKAYPKMRSILSSTMSIPLMSSTTCFGSSAALSHSLFLPSVVLL